MTRVRGRMSDGAEPLTAAGLRVCLVIPYFGRWPFWFSHFLESVRWNPGIQWLFYTDCGVPENVPANTRFVDSSFADYCRRVSNALGIVFAPENPYKLCDLKPCLGRVHQEELRGFDFWGFSDIDVIYGDLERYLAPRLHYDLISTHANRVSGHFCVLRNTQEMRDLFMRVPDWARLLASHEHHAFDEGPFSRIFIRHKNWPQWARRLADRRNPYRQRALFEEAYSTPGGRVPWRDGSRSFPEWWHWQRGELSNSFADGLDYPYFHFIQLKCERWSATTTASGDAGAEDGFVVSANGVSPASSEQASVVPSPPAASAASARACGARQ